MLSQFNFAPTFGVQERKREVVVKLKGKKYANDALWKREGQLDKEILFRRDWKQGRNGGTFCKVLELIAAIPFRTCNFLYFIVVCFFFSVLSIYIYKVASFMPTITFDYFYERRMLWKIRLVVRIVMLYGDG